MIYEITNKATQHNTSETTLLSKINELPQVGLEPTTFHMYVCISVSVCGSMHDVDIKHRSVYMHVCVYVCVCVISYVYYMYNLQARNLVYMVQRRERLKKRLLNSQQELLVLESTLLVTEEGKDDTCEGEGGEEVEGGKGREEEEEEEMDTEHSVRQTRCVTHTHTHTHPTYFLSLPPSPDL